MCFDADIAPESLEEVIALSAGRLAAESVAAADPGLAVVVVERLAEPERLISFGREAKERVIAKTRRTRWRRSLECTSRNMAARASA